MLVNRKSSGIDWNVLQKNDIKSQFMLTSDGVLLHYISSLLYVLHHFGSLCLFWGRAEIGMFKYGAFVKANIIVDIGHGA